ncbi:MAG TPA: hypothetical protein VFQ61_35955 [Polyangiaceae bacterium]|nr:hypothetical protein [Polyangiaceae bacterium]
MSANPTPFEKLFDGPVSSLSLGKAQRAVLLSGADVHLYDGKRLRKLEPAVNPSADGLHANVFFGRDNEPRVLGYITPSPTAAGAQSPRTKYLRYRGGRLAEAKDEIGSLASAQGVLYGVLGHDDPEVVCLAEKICIVKRLSGWKNIPAQSAAFEMVLAQGQVFAWRETTLEQLSKTGFVALPSPPTRAPIRSVWLGPDQALWLVDGSTLHQRRAETWSSLTAPIQNPTVVWGRSSNDVWLGGSDGAAHFDGQSWRCVDGVPGPITHIAGNESTLWIAGPGGAYRSLASAAGTSR